MTWAWVESRPGPLLRLSAESHIRRRLSCSMWGSNSTQTLVPWVGTPFATTEGRAPVGNRPVAPW